MSKKKQTLAQALDNIDKATQTPSLKYFDSSLYKQLSNYDSKMLKLSKSNPMARRLYIDESVQVQYSTTLSMLILLANELVNILAMDNSQLQQIKHKNHTYKSMIKDYAKIIRGAEQTIHSYKNNYPINYDYNTRFYNLIFSYVILLQMRLANQNRVNINIATNNFEYASRLVVDCYSKNNKSTLGLDDVNDAMKIAKEFLKCLKSNR